MILIKLYRQHAGNKLKNLTVITLIEYDHMVNVARLHAIYLLISCYLGTLL